MNTAAGARVPTVPDLPNFLALRAHPTKLVPGVQLVHRCAPFIMAIGPFQSFQTFQETSRRELPGFENSRNVEHLTIVAAAKKSSDLVVVAKKRHEKLCASVLKDESEIAVAAAFEELDS